MLRFGALARSSVKAQGHEQGAEAHDAPACAGVRGVSAATRCRNAATSVQDGACVCHRCRRLVQFGQGIHGPSPISLRKVARARFRRTPTLLSEMPSTSAISWYSMSSSASTITWRWITGSRRTASISRAESCCCAQRLVHWPGVVSGIQFQPLQGVACCGGAHDVVDAAVVRYAEQEGALGALAAKARQRLPERQGYFLQQVVPFARAAGITAGQAPQGRQVRVQQGQEALFADGIGHGNR